MRLFANHRLPLNDPQLLQFIFREIHVIWIFHRIINRKSYWRTTSFLEYYPVFCLTMELINADRCEIVLTKYYLYNSIYIDFFSQEEGRSFLYLSMKEAISRERTVMMPIYQQLDHVCATNQKCTRPCSLKHLM